MMQKQCSTYNSSSAVTHSNRLLLGFPCSLGYGDVVSDGFYEVWGDFPEVAEKSEFPSVNNLRKVRPLDGDPREVRHVVVVVELVVVLVFGFSVQRPLIGNVVIIVVVVVNGNGY
jgi:hypothetical protein